MKGKQITIQEFQELETKVKELLEMHEPDVVLTRQEKKLVSEAKKDISRGKHEKFTKASEL